MTGIPEVLQQPLEDKVVTISRASGTITYPASFMLVAAMNPCLCGFNSHPHKECTCSPTTVSRYQKRISGPLLDRIDVFVEVPPVEYEKLVDEGAAEESAGARHREEQAKETQRKRFRDTRFLCNSEMGPAQVWKFCGLDATARALLLAATQRLSLSARTSHRILKVSRTIADRSAALTAGLAGAGETTAAHRPAEFTLSEAEGLTAGLAEALQYRSRGLGNMS